MNIAIAIIIRTERSFSFSSLFPIHRIYFLMNYMKEIAPFLVEAPTPTTPSFTPFSTLDEKPN